MPGPLTLGEIAARLGGRVAGNPQTLIGQVGSLDGAQAGQISFFSNARFKHMRDAATQKESIAAGKGSVHGNSDWVWGYDPVTGWDKEPFVPTAYAA